MKSCHEWSLEFDLLFDNITSHKAPGFEEYEKSVFLTNAQEAVVLAVCKGTFSDTFESTEATTQYLSPLVRTTMQSEGISDEDAIRAGYMPFASGKKGLWTKTFRLDADEVLFRTLEWCTLNGTPCGVKHNVPVIPVTQDELHRIMANPFKGPNDRRVLRLTSGSEDNESTRFSELVSKYDITEYWVRYIKRPEPIILAEGGPAIHGRTAPCTCKLDEALHQAILTEAVQRAKAVWLN